ncbi:hypothetical protein A2647_01870 [Candidatus Nomurabacteria bacterium RIFCSPHIGHO2_01_FULL_40_24b]|uniref:Alpha/beta hydrolase n=2 Tax=Parcubacteria group TaxID=1794811 RepID=A0A1F6V9U2_9BACT|nr:MAG: hypothetical protein A2647_01870 [Candidatus Nomurabacteria bacterium RIFCSPHIGHO2_01_FULL_40_24b]OHA33050.1 MAG: hypothetical protein A2928_00685 [Candidatus Taylorbacteria bacterium RIFCSPLOWO2_01_FULL_45_15b]
MNNSNLIILPGNGAINKEWAEKARDFFDTHFKSVTIQYYEHWSNDSELIDIDIELKRFANTVNTLNGDIAILAKSVGTILTMFAIYSKSVDPLRVTKCVFVGLPPEWARTKGFDIDSWSTAFTIPSTLIQNDNDPVTSALEIRREQANGRFNTIKLVEVKGDDHVYGDFDAIGRYLIE